MSLSPVVGSIDLLTTFSLDCRFALHAIEQELSTEIKPIPKTIDKELYVAEFQMMQPDDTTRDTGDNPENSAAASTTPNRTD